MRWTGTDVRDRLHAVTDWAVATAAVSAALTTAVFTAWAVDLMTHHWPH